MHNTSGRDTARRLLHSLSFTLLISVVGCAVGCADPTHLRQDFASGLDAVASAACAEEALIPTVGLFLVSTCPAQRALVEAAIASVTAPAADAGVSAPVLTALHVGTLHVGHVLSSPEHAAQIQAALDVATAR